MTILSGQLRGTETQVYSQRVRGQAYKAGLSDSEAAM
jgi:hypothetical protein